MSGEGNKRMNTRYNMIIVKGEIKTAEIACCSYNSETQKWDVIFNNGRKYSYAYENIVWLKNPTVVDPNAFQVSNKNGHVFHDIEAIYEFAFREIFIGIFVLKRKLKKIIIEMICRLEVHV